MHFFNVLFVWSHTDSPLESQVVAIAQSNCLVSLQFGLIDQTEIGFNLEFKLLYFWSNLD